MASVLALLTINIGIDPEIQEFGGLLLTWHGVFTAVGIAAGVYMAVLMGRRLGFIDDDVYSAALVGIPCGIVGARALFVVERWGDRGLEDVIDIFRINEGGISIYGALIGGVLGGLAYGLWKRLPIGAGLDAAAFGAILGQGIGRIGDVINGEHFAKTTDLPWAVVYTHANSPSFARDPQHPAAAYELIGDVLIFLVLFGLWRVFKRDGLIFFTFAFLYSLMRLGVSSLRLDAGVWGELRMAQIVALFLLAISVVGFAYCLRRRPEVTPAAVPAATPAPGGQQARR